MPTDCWWYTGFLVWALLCWLWLATVIVRQLWPERTPETEPAAFAMWSLSPVYFLLTFPLVCILLAFSFCGWVWNTAMWLIYGGRK